MAIVVERAAAVAAQDPAVIPRVVRAAMVAWRATASLTFNLSCQIQRSISTGARAPVTRACGTDIGIAVQSRLTFRSTTKAFCIASVGNATRFTQLELSAIADRLRKAGSHTAKKRLAILATPSDRPADGRELQPQMKRVRDGLQ